MNWAPSGISAAAICRCGAALFRTDKYNAREPDPNNPLLDVLAGSQRVNGARISGAGSM